jgi:hypothetical protein
MKTPGVPDHDSPIGWYMKSSSRTFTCAEHNVIYGKGMKTEADCEKKCCMYKWFIREEWLSWEREFTFKKCAFKSK